MFYFGTKNNKNKEEEISNLSFSFLIDAENSNTKTIGYQKCRSRKTGILPAPAFKRNREKQ